MFFFLLLSSPFKENFIVRVIKSRILKWGGHVARLEEGRSAFKILTGKPTGRPMRRWEYNIIMDIKETGIIRRNWVDSTQNSDYWRVHLNAALNLRGS